MLSQRIFRIFKQLRKPVALAGFSSHFNPYPKINPRFLFNSPANHFENWMQYVQKNKDLPQQLQNVKNNSGHESLLDAITQADLNHSIFSDPNCSLYLLNLLKDEKISYQVAMTTYTFLMVLMEYSDLQPLKPAEQDLKLKKRIGITPLVAEGELTAQANLFICVTVNAFKQLGHEINPQKFAHYILELPSIEQTLIRLTFDDPSGVTSDMLLKRVAVNIPFLEFFHNTITLKNTIHIPSHSIMEYILQQLSPQPMQLQPIFGCLNSNTVQELHRNGKHPAALYNIHIKNNLIEAHHIVGAGFSIYLHDIGHWLWGSLLTPEQRALVFNELVPLLKTLVAEATQAKDIEVKESLEWAIYHIQDFDLTPIHDFANKTERFTDYIAAAFGKGFYGLYRPNQQNFEPIGNIYEDRIFYLLQKCLVRLEKQQSHLTPLIQAVLFKFIEKQQGFARETSIIDALTQLARYAENAPKNTVSTKRVIAWRSLKNLLTMYKDNDEFVKKVKEQYHDTWLALISEYEFNVFPPYSTFTDAHRQSLLQLIDNKLQAQQQFFRENNLNYRYFSTCTYSPLSPDYTSLFQLIKKNHILPAAIASVHAEDEKCNQLLQAINSGDHGHVIFNDLHCHIYLLYLLKKQKINFLQSMTIYTYVLSLMQFTNRQSLKPNDLQVNLAHEHFRVFGVDSFVENNSLSARGHTFLLSLCQRFEALGFTLDPDKLEKFILTLSPSECWLLHCSYDETQVLINDYDKITWHLLKATALLQYESKGSTTHYWVPSATFINHLIELLSPHPVRMQYVFGILSESRLHHFHKNNHHPIALYSPMVTSNYPSVHSLKVGPFSILLHDLFHTFNLNYFSVAERNFIFNKFVPALESAKQIAEKHNDLPLVNYLDRSIFTAIDCDLIHIERFMKPNTRLIEYLARAFELRDTAEPYYLYQKKHRSEPLGTVEDKVYFLLHKIMHQCNDHADKKIWQSVINRINDESNDVRPDIILKTIAQAACDQTMELLALEKTSLLKINKFSLK